MPLLSNREACNVTDAFLITLYGSATFRRWKNMKDRMQFDVESDYVNWLLDIADHYDKESGSGVETTEQCFQQQKYLVTDTRLTQQTGVKRERTSDSYRDSADTVVKKVKYEEPQNVDYESYEAEAETVGGSVSHGLVGGDVGYKDTSNVAEQYNDYEEVTLSDDENNTDYGRLPPSVDDESELGNIGESSGGEKSALEPEGSNYFVCSLASNATSKAGEVNIANIHHDDDEERAAAAEEKKYPCSFCEYSCLRPWHLRRHVSGVHQHLKPHSCPYCGFRASRKDTLQKHLLSKHGRSSSVVVNKRKSLAPLEATPS